MWWISLARPKSAIFITLSSVTKTLRAARSLWMHWKNKNIITSWTLGLCPKQWWALDWYPVCRGIQRLNYQLPTVILGLKAQRLYHLLGGKILHATSHLVGTGDQVFDGHVLHRNLVRVVTVLHARWAPSSQVLPQVALGCELYNHIQRTCTQEKDNNLTFKITVLRDVRNLFGMSRNRNSCICMDILNDTKEHLNAQLSFVSYKK